PPRGRARPDISSRSHSNRKARHHNFCRSHTFPLGGQKPPTPADCRGTLERKIQTPRQFRRCLSFADNRNQVDRRLRRGVSVTAWKLGARKESARRADSFVVYRAPPL